MERDIKKQSKKTVQPGRVPEVISEVKPVEQLDVNQACNEFKLQGTTRIHVLKKFKGVSHTKQEWDSIFYGERVIS